MGVGRWVVEPGDGEMAGLSGGAGDEDRDGEIGRLTCRNDCDQSLSHSRPSYSQRPAFRANTHTLHSPSRNQKQTRTGHAVIRSPCGHVHCASLSLEYSHASPSVQHPFAAAPAARAFFLHHASCHFVVPAA